MTSNLPSELVEFITTWFRPCIFLCDGTGRIHERHFQPDSTIPADIRDADSLDRCLSRPVRDEWIEIIRDTICMGRTFKAIVIVDGVGFDLVTVPATGSRSTQRAWVSLTRIVDWASEAHADGRRILCHHEWGGLDLLSRAQLDTLRLVTLGLSNQQIADRLHRSKRAVEWHIRHLHRLLSVCTREALARIGRTAAVDCFSDDEWEHILNTRPARRSLEEFALADRVRATG